MAFYARPRLAINHVAGVSVHAIKWPAPSRREPPAMSDALTDRLPPHNRDAERGVIGGILRDPDTLPAVQQILVTDNYYFDAHQKIYQALCDLSNESQPIDLVLLYDKLRKNKQLEDVGGQAYLVELWEAVPTGGECRIPREVGPRHRDGSRADSRRQRDPARLLRPHAIGRRTRRAGRAEDHGYRESEHGRRDENADGNCERGIHAHRFARGQR